MAHPQTPRQWITSLKPDPGKIDVEEAQILAQASKIMERRMRREGDVGSPEMVAEFLKAHIGYQDKEVFYVLCLDTRHRVIGGEVLFTGTIDCSEVHPREVVKLALKSNASAVIVSHNHPSGDVSPSAADRAVTQRLKQALALVDIRLLDHLVVSYESCTSMAAKGWI